ncbi:unnamed protein product [Oncorhynchus mykiss]|uniref:Uncharacterized protein n=1 Tax=Oncorhynchus mykiss TaxID=8022 RepID=A0A060Z3D7_ONCMY|nr:unnamed protein product [Oncorhynchus mykiss]
MNYTAKQTFFSSSSADSVMTWGPYLYTTSLLDDYGLREVNSDACWVM